MKKRTIKYGQTEVTCTEKKGKIEVKTNQCYDEFYDHPTLETELANNTSLFLSGVFKNLH